MEAKTSSKRLLALSLALFTAWILAFPGAIFAAEAETGALTVDFESWWSEIWEAVEDLFTGDAPPAETQSIPEPDPDHDPDLGPIADPNG